MTGSCEFRDGCSHASDGAGSCDEDVFCDEVPGERGVDGVAEGIEGGDEVFGDG